MKRLLPSVSALPSGGGPNTDAPAEQEEIDRLVQDVHGLTAAKIAVAERVGPS